MECVNADKGNCRGDVELRPSLTGTGLSIARCDRHWEERLDEQDRINSTYGVDSDVAPDWIDPSYAGERWDEDY
jgi:hypothetical protein